MEYNLSVETITLSVVIPCFDEMANLQKGVLDKVEHFLLKKKYSFEILVVDDGSTDGSREFLEEFVKENKRVKLIKSSHTGKAGAVTKGMRAAKGEYVLFTDMDQATPIEEVDKLFPHFNEYDIVIGSRSNKRKGAPLTRLIMARGMIMLRKILIGIYGISDTQCGFKMFRKEVARELFQRIDEIHNGFHTIGGSSVTASFDVELLFIAEKMGYKIKEIPVRWLYVETRRVNPIKDSLQAVFDLIRIRINSFNGKYLL